MKIVALMSDPYGGSGGIAQFNRDLLDALSNAPGIQRILSLPRHRSEPVNLYPKGLTELRVNDNPIMYTLQALTATFRVKPSLIVCGHLYLLPAAVFIKALFGIPIWLVIYGVEAWNPRKFRHQGFVANIDFVTSISRHTRSKFLSWAVTDPGRVKVLPCTFDPQRFRMREKPAYLLDRYGLRNTRILFTLGRIVKSEREKGHDRVIDVLPGIVKSAPDVIYLIGGDGDDRERLQEKCEHLGLSNNIRFTGQIPFNELVDHYNLADAFVMPSTQEGFGIVFLEAQSCGLPILYGMKDGSRDAITGDDAIPIDPNDAAALSQGLKNVLELGKNVSVASGRFGMQNFQTHVERIVRQIQFDQVLSHTDQSS